MYNQVSLADLIQRIRERSDMLDSEFVTDREITAYCNESLGELYDMIVQNSAQEFFLRSWVIPEAAVIRDWAAQFPLQGNTTPPVQEPFVVLPRDFYMIKGVDIDFGDGIPWNCRPFNFTKRNHQAAWNGTWQKGIRISYRVGGFTLTASDYPPTTLPFPASDYDGLNTPWGADRDRVLPIEIQQTAATTFQYLHFTPNPPNLEGTKTTVWYTPLPAKFWWTDQDPAEFPVIPPQLQAVPGYAHWDEYMIVDVAAKIRDKEESETANLLASKAQIAARIVAMAPDRDAEFPDTVQEVLTSFQAPNYPWYWPSYGTGGWGWGG